MVKRFDAITRRIEAHDAKTRLTRFGGIGTLPAAAFKSQKGQTSYGYDAKTRQ